MRVLLRTVDFIGQLLCGGQSRCGVCGRPGRPGDRSGMCESCKGRIPMVVPPLCSVCGAPLRVAGCDGNTAMGSLDASHDSSNLLCGGCSANRHYFERARAVAVYDGAAREHIHELKYRARLELVPALAQMMAEVAISDGMAAESECIVPVPLHPTKEAMRGYNQAELLARDVGLLLGAPMEGDALHRKTSAGSQTFLNRRDRRANVIGAFSCPYPSAVAGKAVLLVDDVLTSGATADGCSRALLRAGTSKVYVLTFGISVVDERDWLKAGVTSNLQP